jgi:hypothetical protein
MVSTCWHTDSHYAPATKSSWWRVIFRRRSTHGCRCSGTGCGSGPCPRHLAPSRSARSEKALNARARVVCTSWVFSFTAHTANVPARRGLPAARRHRGRSHRLPSRRRSTNRRASTRRGRPRSCGFKWLWGPYATGLAWLRPELIQGLEYEQGHWLTQVDEISSRPEEHHLRNDLAAAA